MPGSIVCVTVVIICNIHCFKCQIEVYSKYKHQKPMQGATPGPRFCAPHRHSSQPPWGMCVHASSGVSVGAPFICSRTNCVPSCGSLIFPQPRSTRIPGPALLFLRTETHPSVPTASAIPSVKMLPRSTQHPQLPAGLLHLEVRPAQSTCPELKSLIPHQLALIFPIPAGAGVTTSGNRLGA